MLSQVAGAANARGTHLETTPTPPAAATAGGTFMESTETPTADATADGTSLESKQAFLATTVGATFMESTATPQAAATVDPSAAAKVKKNEAATTGPQLGKQANHNPAGRRAGGGVALSRNPENRELKFFFEDEIFRIDHLGRVRFGVVTGTSECYSSDDEEEDYAEMLGKGEVRVAFYPDSKEVVRTEQSIGLVDRTLMPGDVVRRRLPGQKQMSGQAGYVRDVNVRADVKVLGTKYVIRNVPSERMKPISEWARDVPVCLGHWIGYTVGVHESAVLKSNTGNLLEIKSEDFHKFKDADGLVNRDVFTPSVYYPNNVVIGRLPPIDRVTNLTPNLPLPPNRKRRSLYTVQSVKTTSINVAWTFKTTPPHYDCGCDADPMKQPETCVKGDDLANIKRLNIYESYMLQIHDRFYLKYSKCDKLIKYSDWEEEQSTLFRSIFERQKSAEDKLLVEHSKPNLSDGGLDIPSSSGPSSSRNAHNIKMRRQVPRSSHSLRLNRAMADYEATHLMKGCETSRKRDWCDKEEPAQGENNEEEATELAAGTSQNQVGKSPSSSFSIQADRIVKSNFSRRMGKRAKRFNKKPTLYTKQNDPIDGDTMVVETLVVYSSLTVVWQDGSVEAGIPSTDLCPIHHLDNHEFFPGDFVSKANDCSPSLMDYGVIQSVDHDERIAKVKWFNIYGSLNHPVPSCKEVEELSVYDLKDHADYQYRPGTMVIRVSNFTGEDANSTAGQVIDNFPDGRVRVWWTKGHITMCYPQDLFEIHTHDSQDPYESDDSENSWETQSENSQALDKSISNLSLDAEHSIIKGMELATEAIERLEKIVRVLPQDQRPAVLDDLLGVYTNCFCLDKFFSTCFFHEDHFSGLLKRKTETNPKKQSGKQTAAPEVPPVGLEVQLLVDSPPNVSVAFKLELSASGEITSTSTPNKRKSSTHVDEVQCKKSNSVEKINDTTNDAAVLFRSESELSLNELVIKYRNEYADMIKRARSVIFRAFERYKNNKNDSGVHSRGENSSYDIKDPDSNVLKFAVSNVQLVDNLDPDVCEIFCFLLKEQLEKCRVAVMEIFAKNKRNAVDEDISDVDGNENVDDYKDMLDQDMPEVHTNKEQGLNLKALSESLPPLEDATACSSPATKKVNALFPHFEVVPNAPKNHHFIGNVIQPSCKKMYQHAIQREYNMLNSSLPPGVIVRAYEDRMDLMSVMMVGPKRTPYENALFFFDFQMGPEYPRNPPSCHYISFCTERLNPNLYEEGKVCVSLLGTWTGKDNEVWTTKSTMLQVLVSIQGLILVDEPYYNEAGYEKQRGTQLGNENSRVYNEMAIIKMAHSTVKQLQNPPQIFRKELMEHYKEFGAELHGRMQAWADYSAHAQQLKITSIKDMPLDHKSVCDMPDFPLLPCSRGFCVAVKGVLQALQNELDALARKNATAPRAAPEDV